MDFIRRWKGPWGHRKTVEAVAVGIALLAALSLFTASSHRIRKPTLATSTRTCQFPAIFNFGDSNSDTGSVSAAFGRFPPPNGRTFFGQLSGRYSDGRLIIDFLAEKLGLPFLSAYLDSIGTNFRHGANFAASGATIKPVPTMNPIHLGIQLSQFDQFKARTIELYNQVSGNSVYAKSSLPRPEDFSKSLYTIDIGQNDLHAGLTSITEEEVEASVPGIIDQFAFVIEKLYEEGARAFWVHNTGPIGCLPYFVRNDPPKPNNSDQNGCVKSYNEVAQVFNKQLKDRIYQLRIKFQDASLIYVDIYRAKYSLISEAKENGFVDPLGYCCGHHGDYSLGCGEKAIVNGNEVYGASCSNLSEYISWDNIHYTDAANHWVSRRTLNGSLSDPQIPITEACRHSVHAR